MCEKCKRTVHIFLQGSSIPTLKIHNVYGNAYIYVYICMHTLLQWPPPGAIVNLADVLGFGSKIIAKMPLIAAQTIPITNIGRFPPFPNASSIGPLVREIMICVFHIIIIIVSNKFKIDDFHFKNFYFHFAVAEDL